MDDNKMQLWAHRGGAHIGVENSLKAVSESLKVGVDGIHINVQRIRDDSLILFADETLDEKTNSKGWVKYLPLTESAGIRLQESPLYMLDTFIPWYLRLTSQMFPRPVLNIEIPNVESMLTFIEFISPLLDSGNIKPSELIVSSEDWSSLRALYSAIPQLPLAGIFSGEPLFFPGYVRDIPIRECHIKGRFVNPHFVREAVSINVTVRIMGVNNPEHVMLYKKMGATGIITDAPDLLTNH